MTTSTGQAATDSKSMESVDTAVRDLRRGAVRLSTATLQTRLTWLERCVLGIASIARAWVDASCAVKQVAVSSPAEAEDILGGPVTVLRFLRLLAATLQDLASNGKPKLPGAPRIVHGQIRVPVFPTRSLFDSVIFRPITMETWLDPSVDAPSIFGESPSYLCRARQPQPRVALVLGAGNVAAIPATDALSKIFQEDCAVLLKMNPVNAYVGPFIERAFEPLVEAEVLRIVYGGSDVGAYAVDHPQIDTVHVTGSVDTHDAIVWGTTAEERAANRSAGTPRIAKPVTSELGNVTPWTIVPGDYSDAQLRAQAESVAASITNNVSYNCISSKMLITWKSWPKRAHFLDLVDSILEGIPRRHAYYPGSRERFERFSGQPIPANVGDRLPWTLLRDRDPEIHAEMFRRESFVCITGETSLEANSPEDFLERSVRFMNERMTGTLAVGITVPDAVYRDRSGRLDAALRELRYGTVGINQWPGVAYGLMAPPWGAFPVQNLRDVISGLGFVHNTYLLDRPQKTVLRSPLTLFPKPVWFSTHQCPQRVAWKLFELYVRPSVLRLPPLFAHALRG